jgi:hypothetical protein
LRPCNSAIEYPQGVPKGKALPRTAIRGRAAVDRIDCALSCLWLLRSMIVVSIFIGPGWLPERLVRLQGRGDEDDAD